MLAELLKLMLTLNCSIYCIDGHGPVSGPFPTSDGNCKQKIDYTDIL